MTTGRYFVNPEIDALPPIELGVQVLWPTRTNEDLGTGDFGFAMQVDLFEEIDLGDWGSVTPFASFGRLDPVQLLAFRVAHSIGA